MYQIRSLQTVPITPGKAWDFLSDPENLKKLTPEHMGFHILSGSDRPMFPGQIIEYKISPFPCIGVKLLINLRLLADWNWHGDC